MTTRRALVTGANGEIGSSVCERLRADGVLVRTMDKTGSVDVVADPAVDPIPPWVVEDIDICVTVAGVLNTAAPSHSIAPADWSREIDTNFSGAFRVIHQCLGGMRERRFGRIVAISCMAGRKGTGGRLAYAPSKDGLLGLVRTVAMENCGHGITANLVLPSVTATSKVMTLQRRDQDHIAAALPGNRVGHSHEVADLVAFLASDYAGHITAQDIGIGGRRDVGALCVRRTAPDRKRCLLPGAIW
jgi:NAD(P)-dependent dehydrogenase (short-subunit alcohol dehydrogenase family)